MRFVLSQACACATHLLTIKSDEMFRVVDDALLFRGTNHFHELWTEMRVGSQPWRGNATIHRGFSDLYEEMRSDVCDTLLTNEVQLIAGHSLGGVFAVLAADDMRRIKNTSPRRVITIGTPRIGNYDFRESIDSKRIVRIYNRNDPVIRLPPLCRHVGEPICLEFSARGIENHHLENYIYALNIRVDELS